MVKDWFRFLARSTRQASSAGVQCPADEERDRDFYGGALVGADTIGALALSSSFATSSYDALAVLEPDPYFEYVRRFIADGRRAAGEHWRYADIVTALGAAASLLEPSSYLEIGVRRGRSMAAVAQRAPACAIVGVDLWTQDYAGMANPGPAFVRAELEKVGFTGSLDLVTGDSHSVLPQLFAERPELSFDLVAVDGDHSAAGARRDLEDVLPRLRIGGALVFDDTSHPTHPELERVWRETVTAERRYATWAFDDVGYGVGIAVRRW